MVERGHVLVIEDEPNITEALRFILRRDGWAVSVHGNGADALAAIRDRRPDLVILDVMLPGRSGYDLLRDIRAAPDLADIPVLMLTARGQQKDRETAAELGADLFMTKPFSNREVVEAVGRLARTGRGAAGSGGGGAGSVSPGGGR